MNLHLGKRFLAKNLLKDAKFKEADKYVGNGNYYDPSPDGEDAVTDTGDELSPDTDLGEVPSGSDGDGGLY